MADGQAVPAGAGTPPVQGSPDPSAQLQELAKRLLGRVGQTRSSIEPKTPQQAPNFAKPDTGIAQNRKEASQMFAHNLFALIHNAAAAHKETQTRHAVAKINSLNNAWQKAQDMAGGDEKKAQEIFRNMPEVTDLFDPKNKDLKQMEKLLQMDMMNPEKKKTVWHDALGRVMKASGMEGAMKGIKALMGQHQQKQVQQPDVQKEAGNEQQARAMADQVSGSAKVQPTDPKMVENIVTQARLEREHKETTDFRKAQMDQNFQLRKGQLDQRKSELEQRAHDSSLNRDERIRHDKEMEQLRKEQIQLMREKAKELNQPDAWADLVRRQGLTAVPAKERTGVVQYMKDNGMSIPKPLSATEQKNIDDVLETSTKVDGWLLQLDKMRGPDGKLPNKPFHMLSGTLAYYAGINTPESALISDFSRERWQAIAPLLHGVRRGDIIRDIVKHTPDPYKDSVELMYTKLQQLKQNYSAGRDAILHGHGFDVDPATGEDLAPAGNEDDIDFTPK